MIVIRDLFELLEKVIDRCRDAGNVIFQIVLEELLSADATPMTLVLCVILFGLVFEYINGFHDTANAIATVVSTRVLSPRQAVLLAAVLQPDRRAVGHGRGHDDRQAAWSTPSVGRPARTLFCALLAAIVWNLLTWWLGLPSSSSHALIGGLCGADRRRGRRRSLGHPAGRVDRRARPEGLWPKVVLPMIVSPIVGLVLGFLVMGLLMRAAAQLAAAPRQLASSASCNWSAPSFMGLSHGTNDAQKTMGIIALALFTATQDGVVRRPARLARLPAHARVRRGHSGSRSSAR